MSLTQICANPQLRSKNPERKVLLIASVIFLPARSRLTHSLKSLTASEWSQLRLPELTLLVPAVTTSGPGLRGTMNAVPGATIA